MRTTSTAPLPETPSVLVTRDDGIVTVTLHNPARRNAVTDEMLMTLETVFAELEDARLVVLRGEGTKAFCSGFDLSTVHQPAQAKTTDRAELIDRVGRAIEAAPVVVIAVLNGDVLGVGLELASACDLRVAREGARVALPAVKVGVRYHDSGARRIADAVGMQVFRHLLHTGELIDVARAGSFAGAIVPADELEPVVTALVERLAAVPTDLQGHDKALIRALTTEPTTQGAP
jgi:enoyl-CoA hydratase/carnithine racemase